VFFILLFKLCWLLGVVGGGGEERRIQGLGAET